MQPSQTRHRTRLPSYRGLCTHHFPKKTKQRKAYFLSPCLLPPEALRVALNFDKGHHQGHHHDVRSTLAATALRSRVIAATC